MYQPPKPQTFTGSAATRYCGGMGRTLGAGHEAVKQSFDRKNADLYIYKQSVV
jgi:hypothetical protein